MVDRAVRNTGNDEKLVLVHCTIDVVVIDQLMARSFFLAIRVAPWKREKYRWEQVQFIDKVEKLKKSIRSGNNMGKCIIS